MISRKYAMSIVCKKEKHNNAVTTWLIKVEWMGNPLLYVFVSFLDLTVHNVQ